MNGLFFRSKHGIPRRKQYGLLLKDFLILGINIFFVYNHTEHVFVKPFVGHDEVSVVGTIAPAVFNQPFLWLAVFVKVNSYEGHGMR